MSIFLYLDYFRKEGPMCDREERKFFRSAFAMVIPRILLGFDAESQLKSVIASSA